MQEAETKKDWFEPVQDRSFLSRLSLVQQKRPLLVSTGPLWKHWNELQNVLLTSSSQWKRSFTSNNGWTLVRDALLTSVCQTYDLLMSAFSGTLNSRHGCPLSSFFFFFQMVNWTTLYFDA